MDGEAQVRVGQRPVIAMQIYPAIHIRDGQAVFLAADDPDRVVVEGGKAVSQAARWREAGARRLHVVDLDAAWGGDGQRRDLTRIVGLGLPVQFGGGIRHMTEIQHILDLGVDRVVVGTQAVRNPLWARELGHVFPGRVVLALDARERELSVEGWTEATGQDIVAEVRSLDDAGLAAFLCTDIGRDGRLAGFDEGLVRELRDSARRTPLLVGGGIRSEADLAALQQIGVDGAVVGRCLYEEGFDLRSAVQRFDAPAVTA